MDKVLLSIAKLLFLNRITYVFHQLDIHLSETISVHTEYYNFRFGASYPCCLAFKTEIIGDYCVVFSGIKPTMHGVYLT